MSVVAVAIGSDDMNSENSKGVDTDRPVAFMPNAPDKWPLVLGKKVHIDVRRRLYELRMATPETKSHFHDHVKGILRKRIHDSTSTSRGSPRNAPRPMSPDALLTFDEKVAAMKSRKERAQVQRLCERLMRCTVIPESSRGYALEQRVHMWLMLTTLAHSPWVIMWRRMRHYERLRAAERIWRWWCRWREREGLRRHQAARLIQRQVRTWRLHVQIDRRLKSAGFLRDWLRSRQRRAVFVAAVRRTLHCLHVMQHHMRSFLVCRRARVEAMRRKIRKVEEAMVVVDDEPNPKSPPRLGASTLSADSLTACVSSPTPSSGAISRKTSMYSGAPMLSDADLSQAAHALYLIQYRDALDRLSLFFEGMKSPSPPPATGLGRRGASNASLMHDSGRKTPPYPKLPSDSAVRMFLLNLQKEKSLEQQQHNSNVGVGGNDPPPSLRRSGRKVSITGGDGAASVTSSNRTRRRSVSSNNNSSTTFYMY